ncbi:MAG: TIGR03960 family B12-binding radical SAM protein [Clostridia bacterium]|nr:TIGR03960 family B12-binding radical SAM protein [Clostridia bacterium]
MGIEMLNKALNEIQKPARYIGGEINSIAKDFAKTPCRVAFCFPDVYDIGMSHLGMKILYHMLNNENDCLCERVFAPWSDMEEKMREYDIPLYSLETKTPVKEFDLIGFTLQYEMSYTNILNMLELAGVPLLAKDRTDTTFVCFGGPCSYNCEPLADFADFVMLGAGEEVFVEVKDKYIEWKKRGGSRLEFLEEIARLEGIYVPSFYDVIYNEDNTVKEIKRNNENAAEKPRKRIIKDMDSVYFPDRLVIPFSEIVHDRIPLEIFRGCTRGCRFCQAGFIYRPVREKSVEKLKEQAIKLIENTGYEEISLTSLSSSDYSEFNRLADELLEITEPKMVNLALPSLRVDNFSVDLMKRIQKVRKSGLTFAPEAGTQRLRDIINKNVTEEQLLNTVNIAFSNGWSTIKLYYMIGLPLETMDDVRGIADMASKVVDVYNKCEHKGKNKGLKVTVSTSTFVPKPFTPFQWDAQDFEETVIEKQNELKQTIKRKQITYNWHESKVSFLEAVFARGDRRLCNVLLKAHEKGCRFDSWDEFFDYDVWMQVFDECGIDPHFYATRKREFEEVLPWSHIDVGISEKYLISERNKAEQGITTRDCREGCTGCGATVLGGGDCV